MIKITGKMSEKAANKVKIIESVSWLILTISILICSSAFLVWIIKTSN